MLPDKTGLKIETFERFMLAHDTDAQSNSFIFDFGIDGRLDRDRLNMAIEQTVKIHPLASARLDSTKRQWRISWQAPELQDEIDIEAPVRFDLEVEGGLRIGLRDTAPGKQQLTFVIHHACLDALGVLQFIKDLSMYYSALQPAPTVGSIRESITYLKRFRGSYGGNRLLHLLRWPADLVAMLWAYEMILNRPTTIEHAPTAESVSDDAAAIPRSTRSVTLDVRQSSHARDIAKSNQQTLNDHLLSSCFLAIESWFDKYDPTKADSLVRLMVPISLRRGAIKSASNMVAMVNLDRRPRKRKSPQSFRRRLSLEMTIIKRFRSGITANRFLGLEHKLFRRWRMIENNTRCLATGVVSNLGDISQLIGDSSSCAIRFDDAAVRSIDFVGPLRPHTNLCIHAYSYQGRLKIVATYNTKRLSAPQVDDLLDQIADQLLDKDG